MTARGWMDQGTTLFLHTLSQLSDEQMMQQSALPGWTGRHLIAHVHYNALALCRLAAWASTGVQNRMYSSPEQRNEEIEHGSQLPPAELRELVVSSATQLAAALDGLSPTAWEAKVVTAQGRTVPATEIPWMRTREVFIHAVDLGTGASFTDIPQDVISALLVDVVRKRASGREGPGLAAWLTGRAETAPTLGRWL